MDREGDLPRVGNSEAPYFNWRSKYCGMEAADIRRLKELTEDNSPAEADVCGLGAEKHDAEGCQSGAGIFGQVDR